MNEEDFKLIEKEIKNIRIKHDNFTEDYKVGFNVALGRILLFVNELTTQILNKGCGGFFFGDGLEYKCGETLWEGDNIRLCSDCSLNLKKPKEEKIDDFEAIFAASEDQRRKEESVCNHGRGKA